jgi:hypothetical protein
MWASQQGSATSAQQRIQVETQVTAFPTLVSATPRSLKHGDATASIIVGGTAGAAGTCGINASAEGAGTKTVKFGDNFNVLNGFLWVATPRETHQHAGGLGVRARSLSSCRRGIADELGCGHELRRSLITAGRTMDMIDPSSAALAPKGARFQTGGGNRQAL